MLPMIRAATETAEKRELLRPLAVHFEGLEPQRLSLLVWALNVARWAGLTSGAASMHHHRVVPHGESLCQVTRFGRADRGRNRSIQNHYTHPRVLHAFATRSTAITCAASLSDISP